MRYYIPFYPFTVDIPYTPYTENESNIGAIFKGETKAYHLQPDEIAEIKKSLLKVDIDKVMQKSDILINKYYIDAKKESLIVEVALPGYDEKCIKVTLQGSAIHIVSDGIANVNKATEFISNCIDYGKIDIKVDVYDYSKVDYANMKNGILTIKLSKPETKDKINIYLQKG